MKALLLATLLLGSQAHAYYIRANADDLSCAGRLQDSWYWLDVKVKGLTVVTVEAGRTETDANAGVAYCDGVIDYAHQLNKSSILINTQTSLITGTLLTVDIGQVCR